MYWAIGLLFLALAVTVIFIVLKISSSVNEQLARVNQALQESHKTIGQNLGSAANIFGSVKEQLGKLEETNRQIYEIGKDISSLQELLHAPKFRGKMGEMLLENLLSQILPKDHYIIQHHFKTSDTVDAVIKLGERLVPIDAKFTLENFQKAQATQDEQQKLFFHKKFTQDVKNRTDEIAAKYILPQENTYDFALMYIPAENVYYEVVVSEDLFAYSSAKKVFPVSPNTFYVYLQIICLGLKGLKLEENTKVILKDLSALSSQMNKFREDFELLGGHLSNASRKYDEAQKKLERFSEKINNIQGTKEVKS